MLPSGISVRIREDLIDGASRTQTTLIIDPIITLTGHRVTMADIGSIGYGKLNGGNSREELISWTGITDNTSTYTLTGCTWGLNFHNLEADVDNRRRHTSGNKFEIKTDMHYIASQFRDNEDNVFTNTDPMEFQGNEILLGDGTNAEDKVIKADNGDANEPFVKYNETSGKWEISNDGVNSYDPEQGGSGVTAGDGIDIVGGEVSVDLDELVDDEMLEVTANRLSTVINEDTGLFKDANGLNIDVIDSDNVVHQGYLEGGTAISPLLKWADIIAPINETEEITVNSLYNYFLLNIQVAQSFIATKEYLTSVSFYIQISGALSSPMYVDLYNSSIDDKPTGSLIKTVSLSESDFVLNRYYDFNFKEQLIIGNKYCFVLRSNDNNWRVGFAQPSTYANGMLSYSNNGGATWDNISSRDLLIKVYMADALDLLPKYSIEVDDVLYADNYLKLEYLEENYSEFASGASNYNSIYHRYYMGSTITPSNRRIITKISPYLLKIGSPTGNITLGIYNVDDNNHPTGSALASKTLDVTTISSSNFYDFEFDTPVVLEKDKTYAWYISLPGNNSSNYIRCYYVSSGDTDNGYNYIYYNRSSWNHQTTYDTKFRIYGIGVPEYSEIAEALQTQIRGLTGNTETVEYTSDGKFKITSSVVSTQPSSVLKLISPSSGTDISGNISDGDGGYYLDLGTNATEVIGTGDEYKLVRLKADGRIPDEILDGVDGSGLSNITRAFGDYTSKSFNTNYEAETDGFVLCTLASTSNTTGSFTIYSDATATPSTSIMHSQGAGTNVVLPIMAPIKKGNYWKATADGTGGGTCYWIPVNVT